mmetsp:Transcript_10070/g.16981  ORF Transcript_10070/g.16981 Transcript_10070/m.16981 type:complete len:103 (+) Transcript_10070:901-1209(+)
MTSRTIAPLGQEEGGQYRITDMDHHSSLPIIDNEMSVSKQPDEYESFLHFNSGNNMPKTKAVSLDSPVLINVPVKERQVIDTYWKDELKGGESTSLLFPEQG